MLTYLYQPQIYNAPALFQYNVTVFEVSVLRLAKGYSLSPVYVIGSETDSNATFVVGQRYVLFLSNARDSCAPSPFWSPCTLPPTPSSATFYMELKANFEYRTIQCITAIRLGDRVVHFLMECLWISSWLGYLTFHTIQLSR